MKGSGQVTSWRKLERRHLVHSKVPTEVGLGEHPRHGCRGLLAGGHYPSALSCRKPLRQVGSRDFYMKRDLLERYRGRWVVVGESGDVVADADELGALLEQVAELGLTADTVQRVPGVDEPIFVGLS